MGARCRFEEEDADTEVSREGDGRSRSEVSVSGLEGAERESGEEVGGQEVVRARDWPSSSRS